MSKNKFVYLAGIIDGEGTITIHRCDRDTYYNYYGTVTVKNTSMTLMKWLVEHFGGSVRPNKPTSDKHAVAYAWFFTGGQKRLEILLLAVLPYLVIKREQAINLLEFVRMTGQVNPEAREMLYQKSLKLNKRGPAVETNTQITDDSSAYAQDSVKIEPELIGDYESDLAVTLES